MDSAGAVGTLHTTRWATGHGNTVALRVFGDQGSLDLNLDRPAPETLRACLGRDIHKNLWKPVKCPVVPDTYRRFVDSIRTGRQAQTSFDGGARVQTYLDASARSAEKGGAFVKVS